MATNSGQNHSGQTHSRLSKPDSGPPTFPNQPITTEWGLHPKIGMWGTPTVNMLATVHNTHLPQFMSPILEPQALAIDALSHDWQGRLMFMFPLFPLLSKVIQKLSTTQEGEVILIAPWWPHNCSFHIYYVFVWTSLSSFNTAGTYCQNRNMSQMQVIPSACLEALMQLYQAEKFSKRSLDSQQP